MQKGAFPLCALAGKSHPYFQAKEPPLKGFRPCFKVLSMGAHRGSMLKVFTHQEIWRE